MVIGHYTLRMVHAKGGPYGPPALVLKPNSLLDGP
ncbi:uncharacterized protein G2W53_013003 [Senna tora]|uniref:Uncharacterized protein n=1 Tax=Senna tora TaxID=362788 RepID=A0A834TY05_9FABA|nr:uncharacterized protein G2W53_013003 [Senna tora]